VQVNLDDILFFAVNNPEKVNAFIIGNDQLDRLVPATTVQYYVAEGLKTVKVEGLELLINNIRPNAKSIHCFISPSNAPSFPEHADDCDVEILCIDGTKTIEMENSEHTLKEGSSIKIPKGTLHRATNKFSSVILSIGF